MLAVLGLSKASLSDLVARDVVKKLGRGKYKLAESVQSYAEFKARGSPGAKAPKSGDADYYKERARKTQLEADGLEHQKMLRDGEFDSVANFESVAERALIDIKAIVEETVVQMKAVADLTAEDELEIDKLRVDGFNRIATLYEK